MRTWFVYDEVSSITDTIESDEALFELLRQMADPGEENSLTIWFEEDDEDEDDE